VALLNPLLEAAKPERFETFTIIIHHKTMTTTKTKPSTISVNSLAILGNPFAVTSDNHDVIKYAFGHFIWGVHQGFDTSEVIDKVLTTTGLTLAKTWRKPDGDKLRSHLSKLIQSVQDGMEIEFSSDEVHVSRLLDYVQYFAQA
jgi:hypothetical protein